MSAIKSLDAPVCQSRSRIFNPERICSDHSKIREEIPKKETPEALKISSSSNEHLTLNTSGIKLFERENVTAVYQDLSSQTLAPGCFNFLSFPFKTVDSHNAVVSLTPWTFTAPVTGHYEITCVLNLNCAVNGSIMVDIAKFINGERKDPPCPNPCQNNFIGKKTVFILKAGDVITLAARTSIPIIMGPSGSRVVIQRLI